MLALYCFEKLYKVNSKYRLMCCGNDDNPQNHNLEVDLYMKHLGEELKLKEHIVWFGKIKNMKDWLLDKSFFLSTSIVEGHPVGAMEAMACGCKPLIHNFPGASNIFPEKYLFNTIDEFIEKITASSYEPFEYREFIEKNYSQENQINIVENILTSLF